MQLGYDATWPARLIAAPGGNQRRRRRAAGGGLDPGLPALTLLPMPFLELIGDRDIAYLTTATAAALVNLGRDAEAHALLQAQWPRFNHTDPFEFALRELRALTEPGVIQLPR